MLDLNIAFPAVAETDTGHAPVCYSLSLTMEINLFSFKSNGGSTERMADINTSSFPLLAPNWFFLSYTQRYTVAFG
jgi:hypothetical protein